MSWLGGGRGLLRCACVCVGGLGGGCLVGWSPPGHLLLVRARGALAAYPHSMSPACLLACLPAFPSTQAHGPVQRAPHHHACEFFRGVGVWVGGDVCECKRGGERGLAACRLPPAPIPSPSLWIPRLHARSFTHSHPPHPSRARAVCDHQMSNPTSKMECTHEDAQQHTQVRHCLHVVWVG